jgi:cell fate regulator YaaT (PSP1 superfamily)
MSETAMVRYGAVRRTGLFTHTLPDLKMGQSCVVRTERGLEIGEVVVTRVPPGEGGERQGQILRQATPDDLAENAHILDNLSAKFKFCVEQIRRLNLPMKLVDVEHLFGGDKIIFYFVSDGRVDFRQLVKDLATEYQTRIELRQIGVRDEARLLGDYERCGQPICCRTFIQELEPVSMRMAKNQKATLDPTKISGRCGRLMCCLRFEDQTYEDLKRKLPRKGTRVDTKRGAGTVVDGDVLTQIVSVENAQGRRFSVPVEEIVRREPRERTPSPPGPASRPAPAGRPSADTTNPPPGESRDDPAPDRSTPGAERQP